MQMSKAARINRLVSGLHINEDAATVDVVFRLTTNNNSQLAQDMIAKRIKQWDPFCNLDFSGDNVTYRGSNWQAIQNQLRQLGYIVDPGETTSATNGFSQSAEVSEALSTVRSILESDDLTDSEKLDKVSEIVLGQSECESMK